MDKGINATEGQATPLPESTVPTATPEALSNILSIQSGHIASLRRELKQAKELEHYLQGDNAELRDRVEFLTDEVRKLREVVHGYYRH